MAKADRIPKKIAGLKLLKSIREAPAIRSLLATPAGRKILGDALIEGAATAAARVMAAHEAAKAVKPAPSGVAEEGEPQAARSAAAKSNGAHKRGKAAKPAPGAAPADDLSASAPQALMPLGEEPATDLDPAKPGAAD